MQERQEEVDQLLDKTKLEMHGAVQSGGRSPKPLNGPSSTPQLKSGSDCAQNSTSSFSSQAKGKKRERGDQGPDSAKRERLSKTEDGDTVQFRHESMLKSEIAKITDKGGLVDFEGVEKLVQLMQPHSADKKIDLAGRIMLVDVIAVTDRFDCLEQFVQLRGLPVLDEWLQEAHKGKIGDGTSGKESDKSVEEFLLALLRALDKLPVNLHALQTCNVGKSVNHLRSSHKNSEIQKKAKSLVDTWKKRVQAEMNMNDAMSDSNRDVSWPNKPESSEVSHVGSRKTGSSAEVGSKNTIIQPSVSKNQVKPGPGEAVSKPAASPGSTKSLSSSAAIISKDQNFRMLIGGGASDLPLTPIKEERSSSSSQSQNNSQSSDHAKTVGSSYREDARSPTAGSVSVNKISGSVRHRKSSNGLHGSAVSGVQRESVSGKVSTPSRNLTSEKASTTGVSHDKLTDVSLVDPGNNRLIVRLPNTGRSPARGASRSSFEDTISTCGRVSPPAEKLDNNEKKPKGRSDSLPANTSSDMNSDLCQSKDGLAGSEEGNVLSASGELHRAGEDSEKAIEAPKAAGLSSKISRSGKSYEASLSPMNALIESCVKFSQANASASPGDDVGMNLLASVAAGEISKSDISPSGSPGRNSLVPEGSCAGNDGKMKQLGEEVPQAQCQPIVVASSGTILEQGNFGDVLLAKNELRQSVSHSSTDDAGDSKGTSAVCGERAGECRVPWNCSPNSQQNLDIPPLKCDVKPGEPCDASVPVPSCSTKEGYMEAEGANQFHEQRKLGAQKGKCSSISDSKLKIETSLSNEDKKADCADEKTLENITPMVSEAASGSAKVEKDTETTCSSSEMVVDNRNVDNKSSVDILTEQKPSLITESRLETMEGGGEDAGCSESGNTLDLQSKGEKAEEVKVGGQTERRERQTGDVYSAPVHDNECTKEKLEMKDSLDHSLGAADPEVEQSAAPVQENEQYEKSSRRKLDGNESGEMEEQQVSSMNDSGPDVAVKLDFDLNEGFPVDDGSHGELVKVEDAETSSAIHLPCPLPFQISPMSGSLPASITVAAPAKGSFVPPENPLRTKSELGWKGSAATSAFRPAEPRKNLETSIATSDIPIGDAGGSNKQSRAPLDFDLNEPDQRTYEDIASQSSAVVTWSETGPRDRGTGGLDLDLNRVDESPDVGAFSTSNNSRLEIPPLPSRSSLSSGLSNGGGVNVSRDFDLNNGPGLDEIGTDTAPRMQPFKSTVALPTPVSGIRVNSQEFGNFSSWFPPSNSFSAITVPSIFPGRGEQSFVAPPAQRVLCPTASISLGAEIYRGPVGPVLSSSPAMVFPPASPFQYQGFPFETNFSLPSNSFSGCSTAYMDSSSGGALCFPTIPSQLVGAAGVVSSPYPRPVMMGFPGGTSNIGPDARKWGSQGLDLNAGPGGGTDTERRDERLPPGLRQLSISSSQALVEDQLKMFQVGGVLKRKEPDGGLDAMDRISYKQPSWQ